MLGFEWVAAGNSIWMTVLYFQIRLKYPLQSRVSPIRQESRRVPEDGADFFNPLLL